MVGIAQCNLCLSAKGPGFAVMELGTLPEQEVVLVMGHHNLRLRVFRTTRGLKLHREEHQKGPCLAEHHEKPWSGPRILLSNRQI